MYELPHKLPNNLRLGSTQYAAPRKDQSQSQISRDWPPPEPPPPPHPHDSNPPKCPSNPICFDNFGNSKAFHTALN